MEELRDKNGLNEERFLREYDVTKYFRPSVTCDAVLFYPTVRGLKILLIRRGGHPYIGKWAFPGGFVEADEPCETTAVRELSEETGITGVALRQLVTVSTPGRDPRWRNITVVFCAETAELAAEGGDDAAAAKWLDVCFKITEDMAEVTLEADGKAQTTTLALCRDGFGNIDLNATKVTEPGIIAFDHAKIMCYLYEAYNKNNFTIRKR